MRLGELIRQLECIRDDDDHKAQDKLVRYDFCTLVPRGLQSYRGYYDQLALGYSVDDEELTVGELLTLLRSAVGKTFTGYKGGEYTMAAYTEVWVDNVGDSTGTQIVGVRDGSVWVTLLTRMDEDHL